MARSGFVAFFIFATSVFSANAAETTVGWRGDSSGRYPNADPPTTWSPSENVLWKTELPGRSYGSPILVGDRLYVVSDPAEMLCIDATDGQIVWQRSNSAVDVLGETKANEVLDRWSKLSDAKKLAQRTYSDLKKSNPDAKDELDRLRAKVNAADEQLKAAKQDFPVPVRGGSGNTAATPICDGEHVYGVFGTGIVAAYTLDGELRWSRFVEGSNIGFGHSSSPLLVDAKLIVHFRDLIAIDTADGSVAWRTELTPQHATPIAISVDKATFIVSPAGSIVRASDGAIVVTDKNLRVSEGSAITQDDIVYAVSGKANAFSLAKTIGESIELKLAWQASASRGRRTPSPVIHKGLLYGVTTDGILAATDTKSGEIVFRKRLDLSKIYSSLTLAGDYIYLTSTNGETIVLAAGREYREIERNELEPTGSNPVFADKRMYVRGHKHLYCIGR